MTLYTRDKVACCLSCLAEPRWWHSQSGMTSFGDLSTMYHDSPYLVWAALGATAAILPLSSLLFGRPSKPPPPFLDSQRWQSIPLARMDQETENVKRLT